LAVREHYNTWENLVLASAVLLPLKSRDRPNASNLLSRKPQAISRFDLVERKAIQDVEVDDRAGVSGVLLELNAYFSVRAIDLGDQPHKQVFGKRMGDRAERKGKPGQKRPHTATEQDST
jgi:hypothetical protein